MPPGNKHLLHHSLHLRNSEHWKRHLHKKLYKGTSRDSIGGEYVSSREHTKITRKLQSNHHWESPKFWLNRSPTTRNKYKKSPQTSRKNRDAKSPDPTTMCGNQELRGLSWLQSPLPHLRSKGFQSHIGLPGSEFQCQKEKSPQPLAVKISSGCF